MSKDTETATPKAETGTPATRNVFTWPFPKLEAAETRLHSGLDKAQAAVDRVMTYGRGNIDALAHSGRIWVDGVRGISSRALAAVKTIAKESVAAGEAIVQARSAEAFIDAQAKAGRTALEVVSNEAMGLTEAAITLTRQTLEPIVERAGAAREIFAKAA